MTVHLPRRILHLDVWMALGGNAIEFETWADGRGEADAWAALMAAVQGNAVALQADSNPPAGDFLIAVAIARRAADAAQYQSIRETGAEPGCESTLGWWVLGGGELLKMLWRCFDGELPDIVYAEEYANSEIGS